MNGAQVTMIAIMAAGFTLNVALNGQSKGEYSPLISGVAIAIEVAILWWGGFWK